MGSTQQASKSRQLPDYVQVKGPRSMPDGMTNFIQRLMKTQHGHYVVRAWVKEPRRTTTAQGSFRFIIEHYVHAERKIHLNLLCDGVLRKMIIECYAPNFCWDLLEFLRCDFCLERDDSLRDTHCVRCKDPLQQLARHDVWLGDNRVIEENEPVCGQCMNEAATPIPMTDAEEAALNIQQLPAKPISSEFDAWDRAAHRTEHLGTEDFLAALREEVTAAASQEKTAEKRKPWWRRRRTK